MEIRDGLFGTVVVKLGFCSGADIQAALELQERYKSNWQKTPRLGEILASQGKVSVDQVQAILTGSLNTKPGRRFGEVCVELHLADKDKIVEALKEQKDRTAQGEKSAIGEIMVEKGSLRREQVRTVLASQGIEARFCPICKRIYNVPGGMADDFNDCPNCTGPLLLLDDEDEQKASTGAEVVTVSEPVPELPHLPSGVPALAQKIATDSTQDLPAMPDGTSPVSLEEPPPAPLPVETAPAPVAKPAPPAVQKTAPVAPPAPVPPPAPVVPSVAVGKAEPEPVSSPTSPAPVPIVPKPVNLAGGAPAPVPVPPGAEEDLPMLLPGEEEATVDKYGRFHVLKVIGEDGRSVLYEAEDTVDGNHVALRVFSDVLGKEYLDQVRREFETARSVPSELIKRPLEIGHEEGSTYVAEEFARGKSLRGMLEAGHIHLRAMTGVIQQLAQLVKDCHARGLIHMGLRPSQILITPSGKIKVGGFGYPKDAVEDMRRIVEVAGEVPVYSAPELAVEGMPRDHRADIYSIGAIYYHGVTGKPPYSGGSVGELLMRISTEDAVPASQLNPRLPKTISDIIGKMLSIDPVNRYATVGEMLAALELVVEVDSGVAPAAELAYPEQEAEPEGIRPSRRTRGARRHARSSRIGKSPKPARRASTTVPGQAPAPRTASRRTTEVERLAPGTKHASRHMPAAGKSSVATGMIIVAILIGAAIGIGIWYVLKHGG